jgi:hypothetical protein
MTGTTRTHDETRIVSTRQTRLMSALVRSLGGEPPKESDYLLSAQDRKGMDDQQIGHRTTRLRGQHVELLVGELDRLLRRGRQNDTGRCCKASGTVPTMRKPSDDQSRTAASLDATTALNCIAA